MKTIMVPQKDVCKQNERNFHSNFVLQDIRSLAPIPLLFSSNFIGYLKILQLHTSF